MSSLIQNAVTPLARAISPLMTSFRFKGGRERCIFLLKPLCTPQGLKKLEKKPRKKKEVIFKSMWENPECCVDICNDIPPRYDELYYQVSDLSKRKFMRTWNECKNPLCKPKRICCMELGELPIKRRPKKKRCIPHETCPEATCRKGGHPQCEKMNLKGCRLGREPPKCFIIRSPSDCKKICAPYPAFSECDKPFIKKLRPVECRCLERVNMCTIYELQRKGLLKKLKRYR